MRHHQNPNLRILLSVYRFKIARAWGENRSMRGLLTFAIAWQLYAQEIRTTPVVSGIPGPTDIQNAADGSGRLFLVQQNGVVRILRDGAGHVSDFGW